MKARKHIAIGSGDDLALRSGSASIVMKKDGEVAIKGKDVSLEAAGKIVGRADGDVVLKGKKVLQN